MPSGATSGAALALGGTGILVGISLMVAPQFTGRLFLLDLPLEASLPLGVMGCRELVLGGLLLNARSRARRSPDAATAGELRRLLWANVVANSVDVLVCFACKASGALNWDAAALFAGAGVVSVGLGLAGVSGL